MARTQCTDRATQTIALAAAALALALRSEAVWQWVPIAAGALAGAACCARGAARAERPTAALPFAIPRAVAASAALLFAALALAAACAAQLSPTGVLLATIVRAGALVFGGGHVVLPLLQSLVPAGLIGQREFFAGYGATQAMPGPLFSFAAFLGAANASPLHGVLGAVVATGLIFLPSFLLVFAVLPVLGALYANPAAAGALRGANASVVGLLAALLYSPLITSLGMNVGRSTLALAAFALVNAWKAPPWVAVTCAAALGAAAGRALFA
jgi:chromate transporter